MGPVLIDKLSAAEALYGEAGVAAMCGMKARMYRLVKSGAYGLSSRSLSVILRNFPGLREDVLTYLEALGPESVIRPADPPEQVAA